MIIHVISVHGIKLMLKSPLDYWAGYINPDFQAFKPSNSQIFEKQLKIAFFDPLRFKELYVLIPDVNRRTNLGKIEYENFINSINLKGQEVISKENNDLINEIVANLNNSVIVRKIVKGGRIGTEITGNEKKITIKPDFVTSKNIAIFLKIIDENNSDSFSKLADKSNLHIDSAIAMDLGFEAVVFICVEKKEPFKVAAWNLCEESIVLGKQEYEQAYNDYIDCFNSKVWPGAVQKIQEVSLPNWRFK